MTKPQDFTTGITEIKLADSPGVAITLHVGEEMRAAFHYLYVIDRQKRRGEAILHAWEISRGLGLAGVACIIIDNS